MKKIAFVTALVMAAGSLFSCTTFDEFSSKAARKKLESIAENAEDIHETFQRGTVEDNVYTSEFAKIKFTAPDDWTFSSDEELLAAMDIGSDAAGNDDEVMNKLLSKVMIFDAQAAAPDGSNVTIAFENVSALHLDPSEYPLEDHLQSIIDDLDIDTEADGIQLKIVPDGNGYKHTSIAGYDFLTMNCKGSGSAYGYDYEFTQKYYVRYVDDFIMMMTYTMIEDDVSEFEARFEKID